MNQSRNQILFLCPRCLDEAYPVATNCDGHVILRQCRKCGEYGFSEKFLLVETNGSERGNHQSKREDE